MIQHDINDDSGDRDIDPQWQSPPSDAAVAVKLFAQSARQCDDGERKNYDGQRDVRNEQREINRTDPSLALEQNIADSDVIGDIGNQERGGNKERGQHASPVGTDAAPANHHKSNRKQNGA